MILDISGVCVFWLSGSGKGIELLISLYLSVGFCNNDEKKKEKFRDGGGDGI